MNEVKKIRNATIKERLAKQIKKIAEDPEVGKPLRFGLKGESQSRVKPYRLIYTLQDDELILLRFEHRKEVYES